MKRILSVVAAVAALGFVSAHYNISQVQAIVADGLDILKLEAQPIKPDLIGGPSEFKVTDKTIEYLTKLKNDGSTLVVDSRGTITIK